MLANFFMSTLRRLALLFLVTCSGLFAAAPHLVISYGQNRKELGAAELGQLASVEIEALDHDKSHHYRGVPVRDVLALVDAPVGEKLRGKAQALAVIARAADGYVTVFALAEFDAAFRNQTILLVDTQDGAPLTEASGPLRLVCPGDKRPARWVRQLTSLEIVSLAPDAKHDH